MKNHMLFIPGSMFLSSLLMVAPLVSVADEEPRARINNSRDINDSESTVSRSAEVYKALGKNGKVPSSVLKNAKCIAVFPSVVTAALAVGGTHGDGVAFCRNNSGNWGRPAFLDLTGGSLGLQAGVKSADVVLYMTSDEARSAIEKGKFVLGGELSAVAGTFDESFSAPRKGVVAYANTEGVFAGASLTGVNISRDEDEQRAFYGTATKGSLFEGTVPPQVERSVNELRTMLPS